MRFAVEAVAGSVAADPEGALNALADIAEADGADREDWLAKAGDAVRHVQVGGEPRYQVVKDSVQHADRVFMIAMQAMRRELVDLLHTES